LKKRTKKLLSVTGKNRVDRVIIMLAQPVSKSFLELFFKTELLS
jgi:hypothetical protein